MIFINRQK